MLPGRWTGLAFFPCKTQGLHRFQGRIPRSFTPREVSQLNLALPACPQYCATKATEETFSVDRTGSGGSSTRRSLAGVRCPFPLQRQETIKALPSLSRGTSILYTFSKASTRCLNNRTDQRLWQTQETDMPDKTKFPKPRQALEYLTSIFLPFVVERKKHKVLMLRM